ncbi:hypothetical protein D3C87_1276100 [compost metagenome]
MARLTERLDNGSICIGDENRISGLVFGNIRLSLSGSQLCRRRIQQGFRSFILLRRGSRGLHQHGKAFLIGFRLDKCRLCCDDSVSLGGQSKAKISLVKPHQWLPSAYLLPDIDKTFNDLAGNAKAEIALDPGTNGSGEAAARIARKPGRREIDQWRQGPGVGRLCLGRLRRKQQCRGSARGQRQHCCCSDNKFPFHFIAPS